MSRRHFLLPSPVDIVFLLILLSFALVRGHPAINTDGDLGRHIRVGETILSERALLHTDRFSHTMAGEPFVPYEWLSEVAFAAAYRLGELGGVLVLTGLVLATAYAAVALFLQRSGVPPLAAFLVAIASAAVGAIHWLARPHVFSLLGAVATVWILERGGRRAPWVALVVYALWANLHGGFLYGLVLVGVYLVGDLLELRGSTGPAAGRARLRTHGLTLAAAVAGTLLNPSGVRLLEHVTGYLGKSYLVDGTLEYGSPDFHLPYGRLFLVALCAVIAALAVGGRRPTWPCLLAILTNVAFALVSLRNIPLFGIVALPLTALHLAELRVRGPGGLVRRLSAAFEHAARTSAAGPWSALGALAVVWAAMTGVQVGGRPLLGAAFDPSVFPVDAVAQARGAGLAGNLYNEFAWGGFILLHWPEQRVFIDGQTDFYGERLTREYVAIRRAEPGWLERMERRDIRLVILPAGAPLVTELRSHPEWGVWRSDSTATILLRRP